MLKPFRSLAFLALLVPLAMSGGSTRADFLYELVSLSGTGGSEVLQVAPSGASSVYVPYLASDDPSGLVFDSAGNLYASFSTGLIYKITPSGSVSTFASNVYYPGSMAFDPAGNLYVASVGAIIKYTPSGSSSVISTSSTGEDAVVTDSAGDVFAATGTGTIDKISPSGTVSPFATGLPGATSMAIDRSGDLFVAYNSTVYEVTASGSVSTYQGLPHSPYLAASLAIDSAGDLYDAMDGSVYEITPTHVVSLFSSPNVGALAFPPFASVPEPSALALVSIGGLGILGWSRLRCRSHEMSRTFSPEGGMR